MEENYALQVENLEVKRGKFRLENISFNLEPGYIYAIAGENGSGKTTLLSTICKGNGKYKGHIFLEGKDRREQFLQTGNRLGWVSEDATWIRQYSCLDNAQIKGGFYDDFDLELFKASCKRLGIGAGRKVESLSRGELIKFQIAFAVAHRSRLFLLDEVTAGMDPVFRLEFFDYLRELLLEGRTVLMTSHNQGEIVKQTDYVAIMKAGELGDFTESLEAGL